MHQSIPAAPSPTAPPRADPWALATFLALNGKFPGAKTLEPRLSALPQFPLVAQSSSAILRILMCDFLFHLKSAFVIAQF